MNIQHNVVSGQIPGHRLNEFWNCLSLLTNPFFHLLCPPANPYPYFHSNYDRYEECEQSCEYDEMGGECHEVGRQDSTGNPDTTHLPRS